MLLLLTCWVVYAVYGNIVLISDNKDRHCYVAVGESEPTITIEAAERGDYEDAA